MSKDALELSDKEKIFWDTNGYLLCKQVLSPSVVKTILSEVDRVTEEYAQESEHFSTKNSCTKKSFRMINVIERMKSLDQLIDHPAIFSKILKLMGPYIQLMGTEIFVRHPNNAPTESEDMGHCHYLTENLVSWLQNATAHIARG